MESTDKLKFGCLGAFALMCVLYFLMPSYYARHRHEARKTPVSDLRQEMYGDPQAALAKARAILAGNGSDIEKEGARALMPTCLQQAFIKSIRSSNTTEAAQIYGEVMRDYSTVLDAYWFRLEWGRYQIVRARKALEADDGLSARAFLDAAKRALPPPSVSELTDMMSLAVEVDLADWRGACARSGVQSDAAWKAWNAACSKMGIVIEPMLRGCDERPGASKEAGRRGGNTAVDLADALLARWDNRATLKSTANLLRLGQPASAVPFYVAAIRVMNEQVETARGSDQRRALEDARRGAKGELCDCLVESAQASTQDLPSAIKACDWATRLGEASVTCRYRAAMCALDLSCRQFGQMVDAAGKVELMVPPYTAETARAEMWTRSEDIRQVAESIRGMRVEGAWRAQNAMPGADPWKDVPDDVATAIRKGRRGDDDMSRRQALDDMVRTGAWQPPYPALDRYRAALPQFHALRGMAAIEDRRQTGMESLRMALRSTNDPAMAGTIRTCLQFALRHATTAKEYAALFDLTGFYVAEFGPPAADDSFHNELKTMIETSVTEFKRSSPMKHLFMLAVMATCFPDDPAGAAAHNMAMKLGPERVASLQPALNDQEPLLLPSGLDAMSVVAVDNNTEYYLLMFFAGPERFLVRIDPYRRGSVVLSNGTYVTSVISTSDKVVPCQSKCTYASNFAPSDYVITTSSASGSWTSQSSASGSYRLLRAPKGTKDIVVNARSGMVKKDLP